MHGHVKARAVVFDLKMKASVVPKSADAHLRHLRVPGDIGQGLLDDAIGSRLYVRTEPLI